MYNTLGLSAGSDLLGTAESSELPPGPMLSNTPPSSNQLWGCSRPCTGNSSLTDAVEIGYTHSAGDLLTMANTSSNILQVGGGQLRAQSMSLDVETGMLARDGMFGNSCTSAPISRMLSRNTSPLRGSPVGVDNSGMDRLPGQSIGNARCKSKFTTAEEREMRHKAAADKLQTLESNSLLDFEVKGFGKGLAARMPPPAAPLRSRKLEGI
jgi:hypothetical protein